MENVGPTVVVSVIGGIIGSILTWIISTKRNRFELALATWKERTEAHRKINAILTRFIALLDVGKCTQDIRNEIKAAYITYREYNIFLEKTLSDEIHEGLVEAHNVIRGKNKARKEDVKINIDSLRDKLRAGSGSDASAKVLRSYFERRGILDILSWNKV